MAADFDVYLRELAATAWDDDDTEHTDRPSLKTLLQEASDDAEPGARITHEPRRDKSGGGSPDFKITRAGRIAGYVEVKQIDEALSKVLKSDQIKKYRTLTDNLILTDYLEFIWLKPGGDTVRARLAHSEDLSARKLALKPENVEAVRTLLRGFFSAAPEKIGRGQVLAVALAKRAALLRDFLSKELQRQVKEHREGRLLGLYDSFKSQVFHDLSIGDFADAFAQMLSYGLFLARLNAGEKETVTLANVRTHIPGSFALIRELVRFLDELSEPAYRDIAWVVEELLSIVNGIDLAAIHNDLSFRARKAISRKVKAEDEEEHRLFERDPFIYFYEDFLKAYDPAMRKGRGVYYTPPPVVNFIVRAIDDILKDSFGIEQGLADHEKVTVLDFACGTGTFLLEVFERIFETIGGPDAGQADQIVREHLVKNLYGFEYLIAPYTIAHLKLSQYLKDKGHPLQDGERLQVFLTNTLEKIEPQRELMLPALSREVELAQSVKDTSVLVITGNPPYAGSSLNPSTETFKEVVNTRVLRGKLVALSKPQEVERTVLTRAGELIQRYYQYSGFPLRESNSKWLHDDYVKFFAFAQEKMKDCERGIVGVITNHSWLDNPTFRGMRESLQRDFNRIHVLDLHGSIKPKELVPSCYKNGNVFDITKGVCITLLIKSPDVSSGVFLHDCWGSRQQKYEYVAHASKATVPWKRVRPFAPFHMFRRLNRRVWKHYRPGWSVSDVLSAAGTETQIFVVGSLGFQTHRDDVAISFDKERANEVLNDLSDTGPTIEQFASKYGLKSDDAWIQRARKSIVRGISVSKVAYRPFDDRWAEHGSVTMDRPRRELVDNLTKSKTIGLLVPRQIGGGVWRHAAVTALAAESCYVDNDSASQNAEFPLILADGSENFSVQFRAYVDARYDHHYTPEEILGYIYAVLYAPSYRNRYAEFLRIDFPRIPFAETKPQFDALSELGWALVQAHLLKAVPKTTTPLGVYHGKGDHTVEAVRWSEADEAIWINKTQSFAPVPKAVWEFHIGGYQVLDKYLKSRKGRKLSLDETSHIGKVAQTLAFTIDQMARIDEAYRAAFPEAAATPGAEAGDKSPAALAS